MCTCLQIRRFSHAAWSDACPAEPTAAVLRSMLLDRHTDVTHWTHTSSLSPSSPQRTCSFWFQGLFQLLSLQPQCPACGRKWRDLHGQRCRASGSKKREASNCARGILGCIHNHSSDAGLWLLLTVAVRTRVGHAVWTPSQSSSHRTPFRPSSDVEHPSSRPYTTSQTVRNGTFHPYDLRWSAKGISHWTTGGWQSRKS